MIVARFSFLAQSIAVALASFVTPWVGQLRAANTAAIVQRVGDDIRYLASDELEGRGPDSDGLQIAAEFIRDEFRKLGLASGTADGSFMQPFQINMDVKAVPSENSLALIGPDGQKLNLAIGEDFQPLAVGGGGKKTAELVFAGYGISAPKMNYDDFADSDVAGKIIVIIRREPQQDNPKSAFDGKKVTPHSYIRTKLQVAKKQKAAGVIFVNDTFSIQGKKDELATVSAFGSGGGGVPFAQIKQSVFNQLLEQVPLTADGRTFTSLADVEQYIDGSMQPLTQALSGWQAELQFKFEPVKADVANVVGVIEGAGPLAEETIVIGAHYDHLGYGPYGSRRPNERVVHNGADDNATGTAAVIELARRFAGPQNQPARRIVFIGFSGEERGLLGSNYYIKNPLFPLKDTVAMINFDMIGQLRNNQLIVNGVTSAREFSELVDQANEADPFKLKKGNVVRSGDHFGFYQQKIPTLHFFTGLTDQYHTPDDKFETINVEGVVRTIDITEAVVRMIVDMPKRPQFVQAAPSRGGRGAMAYLGITPDYSGAGDGLKVTAVNGGSPAAKGGIQNGDIIIKFGKLDVADIQGLATGLRANKPGDKVQIVVRRANKEVSLDVTLGRAPR